MRNLYTVNPNTSISELKDAIHSNINQAKAMVTSLMFATGFIPENTKIDDFTIYHALWAVDCKIEEVEQLLIQLEKAASTHCLKFRATDSFN